MRVIPARDWYPGNGFDTVQKQDGYRRKHKRKYVDHIAAFDIETSRLAEIDQSIMYIWQMCIDDCVIMGRTWDEFLTILDRIRRVLPNGHTLVIWVHNLSYEFQFLRGIYHFTPDEVFCVESRKVLKCTMFDEAFEFRCSYLQTGMSLDVFTKSMGAAHQKLSGEDFDYDKVRFPWTKLTQKEIEYCYNDVCGLCEAMKIEMERDGDTLYSIPLTSTGYARRDAKRAMSGLPHDDYRIDISIYKALREAFRGGNTHANRFYSGWIIEDVKSADRVSSYPDVLCNCDYPVGTWREDCLADEEDIELYIRRGKALLLRVRLTSVRLRDESWGCPYLTYDKGRHITGEQLDNGRILEADTYETTITDIDYQIIKEEYEWDDLQVLDSWFNYYGKLPSRFTDCIRKYYDDKTRLKNVSGHELFYALAKAKLNSLYGMCAQDPCKPDIEYIDAGKPISDSVFDYYPVADIPLDEALSKHNKSVWLPYCWGVWTTAWARLRLEEGIRLAGESFVYCDTDSVKYTGEIDWTEFNKARITDSTASGSTALDPAGERHYMGVFEQERGYERFITYGAKKYAFEQGGKLGLTISGVSKKTGAKELGKLENFKYGFRFTIAGGLESVYNDEDYGEYTIDGRAIHITRNVCLRPSSYTLSLADDYSSLLVELTINKHFRDELRAIIDVGQKARTKKGSRKK
nr:MAG TPA: DNA polymerase B [Caudoviricetes sp.]